MFKQDLNTQIILASTSPRRRELLSGLGLQFEIQAPDCDESVRDGEAPDALVRRLSLEKASSVANKNKNAWVIGADTIVVIDGKILGKPVDEADAAAMLKRLQGQVHEVWGGFAVVNESLQKKIVEAHVSSVEMIPLTDAEIKSYIKTGEPMDKAGSYAIQGVGAGLISSVEGSYTNVVGLNLAAIQKVLKESEVLE